MRQNSSGTRKNILRCYSGNATRQVSYVVAKIPLQYSPNGFFFFFFFFLRSPDIACHRSGIPGILEEEPDGCCNYEFDEDRRTAPDVCGHGYIPLNHWGHVFTRIGLTINNNYETEFVLF